MKLYFHPMSPNVRRVRLTAAVLGIQFEEHVLDMGKGAHKSPEYLAINPNGAVPTLVDGDFVLTESRAIMQYLASQKPESGLLPRDEKLRADVTRWQFWDSSHFSPVMASIAFEKLLKSMFGMGDPDLAKIEEGLKSFRKWGAVLNARLEGRTYIVGDSLTVADLTLAASMMNAHRAEVPVAEFANVEAWFQRIAALDAWKASAA
jgi:glutathione S-transferase